MENEAGREAGRALPHFPTMALPGAMLTYVQRHARAIGVPEEMIAYPLLANIGAVMGNRLGIQLKAGFVQYPTLWIGIVSPPGSAKSPALSAARHPLDVLQGRLHRQAAQDAEQESDQASGPPAIRHVFTTDATIEALGGMLGTTPGLVIQHDELTGFVRSMDQYRGGKGSDRQRFLSFWATMPTKIDRRSGPPSFIKTPVVAVVGGVQPDLLADMRAKGGREDGFMDRFLLIRPGKRTLSWQEDEVSEEVNEQMALLVLRLDAILAEASLGAVVRLHPAARLWYIDWYNRNAIVLANAKGLRAGVRAKMPLQVARIALILHALREHDPVRSLVSLATMQAAIHVCHFAMLHWERCLPLIEPDEADDPHALCTTRILRTVGDPTEQNTGGWVARTRFATRNRTHSSLEITASLDRLEAQGHLERRIIPTDGRNREEWRLVKRAVTEGDPEYDRAIPIALPDEPDTPGTPDDQAA